MRLWNTNDGRCLMISPLEMFHQGRKPMKILLLTDHISDNSGGLYGQAKSKSGSQINDLLTGLVLVVCESEEILIINAYTMTIVCRFNEDFHNIQNCHIDIVDGVLMITLIDEIGRIHIVRTSKMNVNRVNTS